MKVKLDENVTAVAKGPLTDFGHDREYATSNQRRSSTAYASSYLQLDIEQLIGRLCVVTDDRVRIRE